MYICMDGIIIYYVLFIKGSRDEKEMPVICMNEDAVVGLVVTGSMVLWGRRLSYYSSGGKKDAEEYM